MRLRILRNILDVSNKLERAPNHYLKSDHLSESDMFGYTVYLGNFDLNSLFLVDPLNYNVTISNLRDAMIVDTQTVSILTIKLYYFFV